MQHAVVRAILVHHESLETFQDQWTPSFRDNTAMLNQKAVTVQVNSYYFLALQGGIAEHKDSHFHGSGAVTVPMVCGELPGHAGHPGDVRIPRHLDACRMGIALAIAAAQRKKAGMVPSNHFTGMHSLTSLNKQPLVASQA